MLVLVNGEYVVLERVQHEILESPIAVYNFQVEDDHTYYVGESGVLVHNACRNPGGRHGGSLHRGKVKSIKNDLTSKGWNVLPNESRVYTANGYRYPDIIAKKNGVTRFYQVGKVNKNGVPIAREMRAINDLFGLSDELYYIPYN